MGIGISAAWTWISGPPCSHPFALGPKSVRATRTWSHTVEADWQGEAGA
uniref:Uncharacterized protein n=1 Tax=Tetraselmis sp. GSL018 TaxID=582737 RepID=A0A061RZG0_9CHLO